MGNPRATLPRPGMPAKEVRDARARAWAYVFECFNSHKKKAAPTSGPDDARKDQHAGTKYHCT